MKRVKEVMLRELQEDETFHIIFNDIDNKEVTFSEFNAMM